MEIKQLTFKPPKDLKYYTLQYEGLKFQIVTGIILGKKQYILRDTSGNECVNVSINEENQLYLSTLQYRPRCTIDHPMKKGESTMIMLKGLLQFVVHHEPEQEFVYFYDISEFDCELVGKEYTITILLPYNNFILYGKTWYERHFNAEINDESLKKQISIALLKLNEIVKKGEVYEYILSEILKVIKNHKYPNRTKLSQIINECFENSLDTKDWMSLFHDIFSSEGTVSRRMGKANNYSCTLFNNTRHIYYTFMIPTFTEVPMKLSRTTIESYAGNIEYEEEISPVNVYKGGSTNIGIRTYPYYREYGPGTGTRKIRLLKPFNPTHSLGRYFSELPWKNKKSRSNRNKEDDKRAS